MRNVLCCSGHDPTGGAGMQADIEAVAGQGCHALAALTTLTIQDTSNVSVLEAVSAAWLGRQLEVLLKDCPVAAIKFGLLGSVLQLPVLSALLQECRVPVVIDPILRAGGGRQLLDEGFSQQLAAALFPHCTVLTPNAAEARRWTGCESLNDAGAALLRMGVQHVLITGGDEPGPIVRNQWHSAGGMRVFERERIAGSFHGAGCTLAATIAARLALGDSVEQALVTAQDYVADTLRHARVVGRGRQVPRRILPSVHA